MCNTRPFRIAAFLAVCLFSATSFLHAQVPLPSGAVAWWRAENNAQDTIGTNHATLKNGATYAIGKIGQGFSLDGANDFLDVTNTATLDFGTNNFTLEAWVDFSSLLPDEEIIFHKATGNFPNDKSFIFSIVHTNTAENALRLMCRNTTDNENDLRVTIPLATGQWYHVAAVRSGDTNLLYLNGALIGSQVLGNGINTGTGGNAAIGRLAVGTKDRNFAGIIDELTLYKRALSTSEIASIAAAGALGKRLPSGTYYSWLGGSGLWTDPSQWSPNGVPSSIDSAAVNFGIVEIDLSTAITQLTVDGGTLNGTGDLTVSSQFNWNGGKLALSGGLVIPASAALDIGGESSDKNLNCSLRNDGTVTWTGARITSDNAPVINNEPGAVFDIKTDATLFETTDGSARSFNNHGTLRKSAGLGVTAIYDALINSGTVEIQGGTIASLGSYASGVAGKLKIFIGGTTPGSQFGQLQVTGAASFAGKLELVLINNFTPVSGQTFAIANASTTSGTFATVDGSQIPGGLFLKANYPANGVLLTVSDGTPVINLGTLSQPNGHFHFEFDAVDGQTYLIQTSVDLSSPLNWAPLSTNVISGGSLPFTDLDDPQPPARFYRAVFVPPGK